MRSITACIEPGTLYYIRPCIPIYIVPNTLQHYCKIIELWYYPTITNFTITMKEIVTDKEKKATDGGDQSPIKKSKPMQPQIYNKYIYFSVGVDVQFYDCPIFLDATAT